MAKCLAGSLSVVTWKEPFKWSLGKNLKDLYIKHNVSNMNRQIDTMVNMYVK